MANFKVPRFGGVPRRAARQRDGQGRQGRASGAPGVVVTAEYETIAYDGTDDGGIARITLQRPRRLNAFTNRMQHELGDAFDRVDADLDVRAVVVTGSGRGFCAGADLGSGERTFAGGKRSGRDPGRRGRVADLRLHQAGDRGGERSRRRRRGIDDAPHGRPVRGAGRDVRLRVHPARDRPRGLLVMVSAAARGHSDRARMVDVGADRLCRRRAGRRSGARHCRRCRVGRDGVRAQPGERDRAGVGHARRASSSGG